MRIDVRLAALAIATMSGHPWPPLGWSFDNVPFSHRGHILPVQSCSSPSCRSSLTTWESLACRKSVNLRFQAARSIRCSWTASLARTYGTFFHALVLALAGLFKTDLPLPFLGSGKGLKAPALRSHGADAKNLDCEPKSYMEWSPLSQRTRNTLVMAANMM